jgi:FPC/CPF motif-containing protein YcgG
MSAHEGVIASYDCEVTVDHFQFFLEACDHGWDDLENALAFGRNAAQIIQSRVEPVN